MLAERMEALAVHLTGQAPSARNRDELRFGNKGSLAIRIAGQYRGRFHDFELGRGGDGLDLIQHLRGGSLKDARRWAVGWLGISAKSESAPQPAQRPMCRRLSAGHPTSDLWRTLWAEAGSPEGSAVERYLASRGLVLPSVPALRFHPACPRGNERLPAMLALMVDPRTGDADGLHRTFLLPDGSGKALGMPKKMMLGKQGIISLVDEDTITAGIGICEGVETGLAIVQRAEWRAIWACGSAGGISAFPVLRGFDSVTIFVDADDQGASMRAGRACAERWASAGREARIMIPPHGRDWHDTLCCGGPTT